MPQIQIRDTRRKQMFMVDDEYLNGYARLCGIAATGVYLSLCRHANINQKCWPSINLIAKELAINERTVRRSIAKLEEWGIVSSVREKDGKTKRWKVTIYTLVDKAFWKQKPPDIKSGGATGQKRHDPPDKSYTEPPDTSTLEGNTTKKETHKKDITATQSVAVNEVNQVMDSFYKTINPTINFANKTQRKATESLIERFGVEKVISIVQYAISIQGEQYAPTITTPYQLKEKLAQLIVYKKKHDNSLPMVVRI